MSAHRGLAVYRGLLRCYPRRFREEYGDDMVLLLAELLDEGPAMRVWSRSVLDLAITVPARHLEAHMHRPVHALVPLLFAAVSAAGVLVAVTAGTSWGFVLGGALLAVVAAALAVASARQARPVSPQGHLATGQWWKLLAIGTAGLATMIIAEGATDLSLWFPMIVAVLVSLLLMAAGIVLGVVHALTGHRRLAP